MTSVINALALNEKHIPYRDSKLTRLLSEALGGVCKTSFITCVSPADSSRIETASSLRFVVNALYSSFNRNHNYHTYMHSFMPVLNITNG
jgi:hypothetical protein